MGMARYMSGNPSDSATDDFSTSDASFPSGGGTGGIFDLLGNYGSSYLDLKQTEAEAQAQQQLAAQQAPVQMAQLANSKLLILGIVVLGVMFLAKKH